MSITHWRSILLVLPALVLPIPLWAQHDSLPTRLVVLDPPQASAASAVRDTPPQSTCPLRLKDQESDAIFQWRRSIETRVTPPDSTSRAARYRSTGFYTVAPAGRYGIAPDQLLEVDCDRIIAVRIVDPGA